MNKNQTRFLLAAAAGLAVAGIATAIAGRKKQYQVKGKVALITGSSRGLGLIMARQLAAEGAKVVICARDTEELKRAEQQLLSISPEVLSIPCDLTNRNEISSLVNQIKERWGGIDILINNAGVVQVGPVETMTVEDFDLSMKIHFWAPLYLMIEAFPDMIKKQEGRVVNISSIGGKIPVPHLLPYVASKFALTGLSEGLHSEMNKFNIHITTVCPGLMQTGSPLNAYFKGQNAKEFAWFAISDSLPGISMDAERAAAKILHAMKMGETELILSLPAKLATTFYGIAPGTTTDILTLVNKLLPAMGGIESEAAKGKDSRSSWAPAFFLKNTDEAAKRNNEV